MLIISRKGRVSADCLGMNHMQGIKAVVTLNEEFEVFISTRQYQVRFLETKQTQDSAEFGTRRECL